MDRRTFFLLTGAASGAFLAPSLPRHHPTRTGRLQFTLDDRRRWSLWYRGTRGAVPVIERASIGVWIGDALVTLADLEDTAVGNRRPPAGESLVIRGRAAGVFLEAEFVGGEERAVPHASVTVSIYPDRYLPTCGGVRFFDGPETDVLPGPAPLVALVSGYDSSAGCRVERLPVGSELASHAVLALTGATHGLRIAFDPAEPGEAAVRLSPAGLAAVSDWRPARPLRPRGDSSTMRLAYQAEGDGLEALAALFEPASPVDRERLADLIAPVGWSARHLPADRFGEALVLANLEVCAARFDRRHFRCVLLSDGYQRAPGDWETNTRFPGGHRWLTDRIHAHGFKAGLWIAPFAVAGASGLPAAHPDWLLRHGDEPLVMAAPGAWGGPVHALDGAHPDVQQWLYDLARRAVRDWGYDLLEADFLHWATLGDAHHGGLTHAESYRRGLAAIRDGLGPEAFLLGRHAPLQHSAGLVNGMHTGPDLHASWGGIQRAGRAAALRWFAHRGAWLNDPGGLLVGAPLTDDEARTWTSLVTLAGGVTLFAGHLPDLPPERLGMLQRALPAARPGGRPVGALVPDREVAPAVMVGDETHPLHGAWRFRTGDDPAYADRDYADDVWETIAVPGAWERAGRPHYDGYAWYRTRFTLPARRAAPVALELGKIADVEATYVNGAKVGQLGGFPPHYRSERLAYRRYALAAEQLNWGGENVLAVRVYDGGGEGGLWSGRRERPALAWVAQGAPRWWTVALTNWDAEPRDLSVPLADLGIAGARFAAYDVWRDAPLTDVRTAVQTTLEPHATLLLALRPASAHPQVIGTTRHLVQGAVDVRDEAWDRSAAVLRGRAAAQDERAYAVTIAVPRTLRPAACRADPPCETRRLPSGHVVLTWPGGGDGRDLQWELRFRAASR
ncbi:MAG: alpha-galactosidase [Gemmatimonadales bacterium]